MGGKGLLCEQHWDAYRRKRAVRIVWTRKSRVEVCAQKAMRETHKDMLDMQEHASRSSWTLAQPSYTKPALQRRQSQGFLIHTGNSSAAPSKHARSSFPFARVYYVPHRSSSKSSLKKRVTSYRNLSWLSIHHSPPPGLPLSHIGHGADGLVADADQVVGEGLDGLCRVAGLRVLGMVADEDGLLGLGNADTDLALQFGQKKTA